MYSGHSNIIGKAEESSSNVEGRIYGLI